MSSTSKDGSMPQISIVDKLINISSGSQKLDDDYNDRLSYRYSAALMICLSVLIGVGGKNFVSEKIRCFAPTELNYQQVPYINDYCYVSDTYYVPMSEHLPGPNGPRKQKINYYQWVELFIIVQAVMFVAPRVFWRFFSGTIGTQIDVVVRSLHELSHDVKCDNIETRTYTMQAIVRNVDRYLRSSDGVFSSYCVGSSWCRPAYGIYIIFTSLIIKMMYLVNVLGQIFLINKFLGNSGYTLWGMEIMREFFSNGTVALSNIFPVVTMCDVEIRTLGHNIHKYTIQCVLPVNVFHDRVYLVIWFWLCFVSSMTIIGILSWMKLHLLNIDFIETHLQHRGRCFIDDDMKHLKRFTRQYLSLDGLFLLKIVYKNTTCVEFDELLAELWDNYSQRRCNIRTIHSAAGVSSSDNTHHKYKYNNLEQERMNFVELDDVDHSVVL